jgi:hypothetical protein
MVMENILLVHNAEFFKTYNNVTTLPTKNDPDDIPNRSCILFLGSHDKGCDHIHEELQHTLFSIGAKMQYKYVILIGKTDDTISKLLQIPDNIIRIYANNIDYIHSIIRFFPMGRDRRSISQFSLASRDDKDILCYCNFSVDTHVVRKKIYDGVRDKPFIKFEHMGAFLAYEESNHLTRDNFFQNLCRSKYTICPRGNALDTFRFYDAIYCGCIPIVVKTRWHKYFADLPILFLDHEDEFATLTEEWLNEMYVKIQNKRRTYYSELDLRYWMDIVQSDLLIPNFY